MRDLPFGNGSGKHDVSVIPLAPDWVLFFPKEPEPYPDDLPIGLTEILVQWFRAHEGVRMRTTLPILKGGNLVGIHVWFDPA